MSDASTCQVRAILIGINWYDNPDVRPLEGCVQDINNVESFLREHIDAPRLHISKITAVHSGDANTPTHENVLNMMNTVKSQIRPNDFVYFHYSGHGGRQLRRGNCDHPVQNPGRDNFFEFLLLHGNRHLKNHELGKYFDTLSEAGANVFAVLDCCHSGGGDRGDITGITGIRQVIHEVPHMPELEGEDLEVEEEEEEMPNHRNASVKDSYWTKARKYTILAACQRYQFARELPNKDDQIQGVLTSTMLESLNVLLQVNESLTYKTLYDNIYVRIKKGLSRRQDPVLYGIQNRQLFANKSYHSNWSAMICRVDSHRVYINIGSLHGVCHSQEYTIYPQGAMERTNPLGTVTIDSVDGDRASGSRAGVTGVISEGCPADLTGSKYEGSIHVAVQSSALYEVLQSRTNAGVIFHDNTYQEDGRAFYKIRDTEQGYQIVDESDNPLSCCPLYQRGPAAADNVFRFLKNFAHYNNVVNLGNNQSDLNGHFRFFERNNIDTVTDGDSVCFLLENLRPIDTLNMDMNNLHFNILNLTVDRKVELLFPMQDEPNDVSPQKISDDCDISMSFPEVPGLDAETDTVTDIFKVIVTDRPCQFASLSTSNIMRNAVNAHEFAELFENILEGDEPLRQGIRNRVMPIKWQTAQIPIHVKRRIPEKLEHSK